MADLDEDFTASSDDESEKNCAVTRKTYNGR
jgi:hypothetical protein